MEEDCKICGLKITLRETNSNVVLTEKAVNEINNAKNGEVIVGKNLLDNVYILTAELGMSILRQLSKT